MPALPRQLVVAAVLRRSGTVLLCRRPLDKRHGGLWELPGGKVHPGETRAEALARELEEELGLMLESAGESLAEIADPGSAFTIAFHPVRASGTPRALEHMEIAWVPFAEVGSYALAPSDRSFVEEGHLDAPEGADRAAGGAGEPSSTGETD